jgi:hypothetical protein
VEGTDGGPAQGEILNLTADRQYAMGRRRFIFTHGVLMFGIPMFFLMGGVDWYRQQFHLKGIWFTPWLILALGFWCAVGYMFGRSRWRSIERRVLRSRG